MISPKWITFLSQLSVLILYLNLSKLLCKNSVKNKDKSFWKWQEIIYASYVFEKEKTC